MRQVTLGLIAVVVATVAAAAWGAEPTVDEVIKSYQLEQAETPVRERSGWHKPKRILLGDPRLDPMVAELRSTHPDIEFIVAKPGEAAAQAANVDVLFGICSPAVLAAAKSVQWIHLLSAGVESCVSVPAVAERDILVTNMRRLAGPVIAEHAMGMTLALTRNFDFYLSQQAKRTWQRSSAPPRRMEVLKGKTLLVVGLGGIGSEVAKRAHAMEMKVIATRASGRTGPDFVSYVGLPDELLKLAAQADVVVNTAPLTPQTTGIFNAAFFATMKPTAYFINVARGRNVDTAALAAALKNGQIAGAALDVADPEPLPADHPLWEAPNLIVTPHVSSDMDMDLGSEILSIVTLENLRRYIAGERMLSVVDVRRGY